MDDYAIKLDSITETFKLPHDKNTTLKGAIINFAKRGYEQQVVLKDFSLTVNKGEFLGILGRNGSGKSTLLKTLSGIYYPDAGNIHINGKLTPFIELGVGFNPELSGKDNVYLNGALLGFSRKEIDAIYDDIVSFAELERFMDQKLKNYSSGMQVRLAFSIAIRADTDILILDEVLAVGDEAFQRKCYDYFNELKLRGKTVVLVTHDMSAVKRFCTRAVVINKGSIIYDGDTDGATDVYRNLNLMGTEDSIEKSNKSRKKEKGSSLLSIGTYNEDLKAKSLFKPNEKIVIQGKFKLPKDLKNPTVQYWFNNPGGTGLASNTITTKEILDGLEGNTSAVSIAWVLDGIFNDGKYLVTAELSDGATGEVYEIHKETCEFNVVGWPSPFVLVHPKRKVIITRS